MPPPLPKPRSPYTSTGISQPVSFARAPLSCVWRAYPNSPDLMPGADGRTGAVSRLEGRRGANPAPAVAANDHRRRERPRAWWGHFGLEPSVDRRLVLPPAHAGSSGDLRRQGRVLHRNTARRPGDRLLPAPDETAFR